MASAAEIIETLRAELREAEHARDGYMAERDMARERLEWSPGQPYDGIAARDETIARLERNRDMWKGQCERQSAQLMAMREQAQQLTYTLGCITNPDWSWMTPDDARTYARAALDAWEAGR